jgi:hypothetical protein
MENLRIARKMCLGGRQHSHEPLRQELFRGNPPRLTEPESGAVPMGGSLGVVRIVLGELLIQPRPGKGPVPGRGAARDAENLSGLLQCQPPEES